MKKSIAIIFCLIFIIFSASFFNTTFAEEKILDNKVESKIIEMKEKALNTREDYTQRYGTEAYGTTAYILSLVRKYSIPVCFIGIAVGVIRKYIIGIRKLDTLERGNVLIVTSITVLIICQILPLAFAVFARFGRG